MRSPLSLSWLSAPSIFGALAELSGIDAIAAWPGSLFSLCRWLLDVAPGDEGGEHRSYALGSVIGGVLIPIALSFALGLRSMRSIGLRRPAAAFFPVLGLALLAVTPLAILMSRHPVFLAGLEGRAAGSPWFLLSVVVGGLAEHFFFHGVLLAWLHPSGVFPEAPEGPLLWPGRRLPSSARATLRDAVGSLSIPRASALPCLLSAPLFFAIHVGQSAPELWLSVPAGIVFAWLAYRTGGLVAPMLVHLAASLLGALMVAVAWLF